MTYWSRLKKIMYKNEKQRKSNQKDKIPEYLKKQRLTLKALKFKICSKKQIFKKFYFKITNHSKISPNLKF